MRSQYLLAFCFLGAAGGAQAQDLPAYCKSTAGRTLGVKAGKPVPVTCDTVHAMAEWFPVPALGAGYVNALRALSKAKFSTFYDNPKDASIRLICSPNLQGYLCSFPLGPAELLIGPSGIVHGIIKTISKDSPEFPSVMAKAAQELDIDSLSPDGIDLALSIEADAMKAGAGANVDVTKTATGYVYSFHL